MSGICGIVNFDGAPVDPELLDKMAAASDFRGQDGINYWVKDHVGLAHLAIHTTPESVREQQPLVNRRGDLVLTADARLDNRTELIGNLLSKGVLDDKDSTDADLILAAYECWGKNCPKFIMGDYAFVVWDGLNRELFCARDSAGVRSICYHYNGQILRFGSDPRQIIACGDVSRDLDGYFLSDLFTLHLDKSRTVFSSVQMVPPGHCMLFKQHREPESWRYWRPDRLPKITYSSDAEYIEHFRELLFQSVADRLRSLKPAIAIQVSGGLDSSSIAAIAQSLYTQGKTTTKPIGFTSVYGKQAIWDESEYCSTLETEKGLELHQYPGEQHYFFDDDANYLPEPDFPLMGNESLQSKFYRDAKSRGCSLYLTGNCGDALFAAAQLQYFNEVRSGNWSGLKPWVKAGRREGVSWPRLAARYVIWPLLPMPVRYGMNRFRKQPQGSFLPKWIHPSFKQKAHLERRVCTSPYFIRYPGNVCRLRYEHILGLMEEPVTFRINEIHGARYGLDMSYPLIDRRIAEFILTSPLNLGARPGLGNTKWLLRQALKSILPEKIRCRAGKGYATDYHDGVIRNHLASRMKMIREESKVAQLQLVDSRRLAKEFQTYCNTGVTRTPLSMFYMILSLEAWLQSFGQPNIQFTSLRSWQFK